MAAGTNKSILRAWLMILAGVVLCLVTLSGLIDLAVAVQGTRENEGVAFRVIGFDLSALTFGLWGGGIFAVGCALAATGYRAKAGASNNVPQPTPDVGRG